MRLIRQGDALPELDALGLEGTNWSAGGALCSNRRVAPGHGAGRQR